MRTNSNGVSQNDSLYCPNMPLKYTGCSRTLAVNTTSCPGVMRKLPSYAPWNVSRVTHMGTRSRRKGACRYSGAEVDDNVGHLAHERVDGRGVVLAQE